MISIIQAAGWPIWPLIFCSVIALALVIERFVSLRASRVLPATLFDEVVQVTQQGLPQASVLSRLADNSTLGWVLAGGLRVLGTDPRASESKLRQALENAGREGLHHLERYLNALGTIATAAPLLGLLGTVIGMVKVFTAITTHGVGNPTVLAGGIAEALITTAAGLTVAIPALIGYRYYRNRVDTLVVDMEKEAIKLVEALHRRQEPKTGDTK